MARPVALDPTRPLCYNARRIYAQKGVRKLPKVVSRPNESGEQLLRRFKKEVMKSKVLADVRRKRWHVSKSELKRIEKKKAIRRLRKKARQRTG